MHGTGCTRARRLLAVAAVAVGAVLVAATAGCGALGGDHGSHGSRSGHDVVGRTVGWRIRGQHDGQVTNVLSAFVADDDSTLVLVDDKDVAGYGVADGSLKWRVRVPAGDRVCASTRSAPDGVAGIVFGHLGRILKPCDSVMAVDVTRGTQRWNRRLAVDDPNDPPSFAAITAAGDTLVASTTERIVAYGADGNRSWSYTSHAHGCTTGDLTASRTTVLATVRCPSRTGSSVLALDPSSGGTHWQTHVTTDQGLQTFVHAVSASPPVIQVGGAEYGQLLVFDEHGRQTRTIAARAAHGSIDLTSGGPAGPNDLHSSFPISITGDRLVALTHLGATGGSPAAVVAMNLTTGSRLWTHELHNKGSHQVWLARGQDPTALTVVEGASVIIPHAHCDGHPRLFTLDGATGKTAGADELTTPGWDCLDATTTISTFLTVGTTLLRIEPQAHGREVIVRSYPARVSSSPSTTPS